METMLIQTEMVFVTTVLMKCKYIFILKKLSVLIMTVNKIGIKK